LIERDLLDVATAFLVASRARIGPAAGRDC
jgi:hypothetical protein